MKKIMILILALNQILALTACSHKHNYVIDDEVKPTCIDEGRSAGAHCSSCGEVLIEQSIIAPKGHNIVGVQCLDCDYKASEELDYYVDEYKNVIATIGECTSENIVVFPCDENGNLIDVFKFYDKNNCKFVKSIVFEEGIERIVGGVDGCVNITSVKLPESLKVLGGGIFFECASLKEISIPDGVMEIGNFTFYGCKSLETLELSRHIQRVGERAFLGCESLNSISFEEVREINDNAFEGCINLKAINLPKTLTDIGSKIFYNCPQLEVINYDCTIEQWNAIRKAEDWHIGLYYPCVIKCTDGEISMSDILYG